jgi:hypothetical protein
MRVAGVKTLEQANHYLETEFLPWVNTTLAVVPASADDAHRPLEKHHGLAAILSPVESRGVNNDCTILFETKIYQIARKDICAGLRGAVVRVEKRRDGLAAVHFRERYLTVCSATGSTRRKGGLQPRSRGRAQCNRFYDGRPGWRRCFS